MTDEDLLRKRLAFILTCLHELETLADPDAIRTDVRMERFVAHTLQLAIQAALDVASHVASSEALGEPESNRALFDLLARGGWLPAEQVPALHAMTAFRNVIVHRYQEVDLAIVEDVVRNRLGDLEAFVAAVRDRLDEAG